MKKTFSLLLVLFVSLQVNAQFPESLERNADAFYYACYNNDDIVVFTELLNVNTEHELPHCFSVVASHQFVLPVFFKLNN